MSIFDAIDATWPAKTVHVAGPWLIREGAGGGNRVSAASAQGPWADSDIALAEAAQDRLGQEHLFMIRAGDEALDAALDSRGYRLRDPVTLLSMPVADLAVEPPKRLSAFCHWPMLQVMRDTWAEGDIGPARIAIMDRALGPKTTILGRINDRVAGAAFVACHQNTAILHALHVVPEQRRQGIAVHMMRAAGAWAQDMGMEQLSVLVVDANAAALSLYASLGMQHVGHYHYRAK